MAHVQIHKKDDGGYAVVINGVDIGKHVIRDGFSIQPADVRRVDGSFIGWEVSLRVFARTLDADLPDAVVLADREEV